MRFSTSLDHSDLLDQSLQLIGYRGSWYSDQRSGLIQFSPEARLLLPFTDKELREPIPSSQFDLALHEDDRAWLQEFRTKPNGTGTFRSVIEYRIVGREGVRWVQAHTLRRIHNDGTPIDGRGINLDVTELKAIGDGVTRNPLASLSQPLNHLAEGVLLALHAAEQARLPGIAGKLRGIARTTGRLLASQVVFNRKSSLH